MKFQHNYTTYKLDKKTKHNLIVLATLAFTILFFRNLQLAYNQPVVYAVEDKCYELAY